jgi:hypothetical protein
LNVAEVDSGRPRDGLSHQQVASLALRDSAEQTIGALCESTRSLVEPRWTRCDAQANRNNRPAYGLEYWATYPPAPAGQQSARVWTDSWFEWGIFPAPSTATADRWAFAAGLTVGDTGGPFSPAGNTAWIAARRKAGFVRGSIDSFERLFRYQKLSDLPDGAPLVRQAEIVADWIIGVFSELATDPPPAESA